MFLLDPACFGTLTDVRAKHTEVLSIRAELEPSSPVLVLCVRPQPHLPVIPGGFLMPVSCLSWVWLAFLTTPQLHGLAADHLLVF